MNAPEWEDFLRSKAQAILSSERGLTNHKLSEASRIEWISGAEVKTRLQFIVDSKEFDTAELHRLWMLWDMFDRACTKAQGQ